jgi:hypothetical protein
VLLDLRMRLVRRIAQGIWPTVQKFRKEVRNRLILMEGNTSLLVTVMGWYPTKRPKHYDYFLISCASPSEF